MVQSSSFIHAVPYVSPRFLNLYLFLSPLDTAADLYKDKIVSSIYEHLPKNVIVRKYHPGSENSQD